MNCPHCATPLSNDARFCPACGKATAPTESGNSWPNSAGATPDLVGRTIAGRYRVVAKLGEGGMGAVYRGEQTSLKRSVAIKVLRPELSTNQMILQRFNAEAQAVAKLSHPNTVNIYDFGQDTDGSLFIAMEFIEGKSLRSVIQREAPFTPARALAIAAQVAASLSDAHAANIVHRDLKPDNVMLQDRGKQKDVARVLDFGIAKLRDDSRSTQNAMTQAGDMLGTPQYMAPEQIKGEAIDGRTDVYALGCMLYEMLTGRMPFEAPTVMAMLSKHLMEMPPPPSQRRPDLGITQQLDGLVLTALAKEPSQRPATMDAYADLIANVQAMFGDPNRSAGMSIQRPVVSAQQPAQPSVQQAAVTPVAFSAFQAPAAGPAFTPAPPGPGYVPAPSPMPPYATPPSPFPGAPQPGYAPTPIPPTLPIAPKPPTAQIHQRPKSRAPLFIIVGLLAFGGAGAAVWFVSQNKKTVAKADDPAKGSATPTPTPPDDKPKVDPWGANGGSAAATNDNDNDDDGLDEDDAAAKLGAGRKPKPAPAPTKTSVGTAKVPLPKGAYIDPPDGYVATNLGNDSKAFINYQRGILIAMGPLDAGTNDPNEIAKQWTKATGATFMKRQKVPSHGAARDLLIFTATYNNVRVGQMAVLYITDSYRIGVLLQAPAALFQDASFQQEIDVLYEQSVHLP